MHFSISTDPLTSRFSLNDTFRMIVDAGFDAVDLGLFSRADTAWLSSPMYLQRAFELKKAVRETGLFVGQIHAPFPTYFDKDPEKTRSMNALIVRSLQVAADLECPYVIVHPATVPYDNAKFHNRQKMREVNFALYESLLPTARQTGVKVALENLFAHDLESDAIVPCFSSDVDDLIGLIDELGKWTTACLDVGHSVLTRQDIVTQIEKLGGRLTSLHIQSNDAVTDLHTVPFMHDTVVWPEIRDALLRHGYGGTFNLEVFGFFENIPNPMIPAALSFAMAAAKSVFDT